MIEIVDYNIHLLFSYLALEMQYDDNRKILLTEEDLEESEIDPKLKGYTVQVQKDGQHYNDGQLVDYSFTFTSPKKKKTYFNERMCLMIGFRSGGKIIIN